MYSYMDTDIAHLGTLFILNLKWVHFGTLLILGLKWVHLYIPIKIQNLQNYISSFHNFANIGDFYPLHIPPGWQWQHCTLAFHSNRWIHMADCELACVRVFMFVYMLVCTIRWVALPCFALRARKNVKKNNGKRKNSFLFFFFLFYTYTNKNNKQHSASSAEEKFGKSI